MKRFLSLLLVLTMIPIISLADGFWSVGHYVDEFDEETGEDYNYISVTGTFNNSVVTKETLTVKIIADLHSVQFSLLEYGDLKITNPYSDPTYTIRVKDGNDEVHTYTGMFDSPTGRIILDDAYSYELINIFKAGGKIRFSITDDNSASTRYVFSIEAENFELKRQASIGSAVAYVGKVSEGMAPVISDDKMGAIDVHGNIIIPCVYDIVGPCSDGMVMVYKGEYLTTNFGVRIQNGLPGKAGFADKDGKVIIDCIYDCVQDFSCGLAFVKKANQWGVIDKNGALVIPFQYDWVRSYHDGVALVFKGTLTQSNWPSKGTYSLIDTEGNEIYSNAEGINSVVNGLACITVKGKKGCVNTKGEIVIQPKWDEIVIFDGSIGYATSGSKSYIIDAQGKTIVELKVKNLASVELYSEGIFMVRNKNYDRAFMTEKGKMITGFDYEFGHEFHQGLALVQDKKTEKWGIIDKNGKLVMNITYDEADWAGKYIRVRNFTKYNEKTGVRYGGPVGLIDTSGKILLDLAYNSINYSDGYYTIGAENRFIIMDEDLNEVF